MKDFRRILVPIDFGPSSRAAVRLALDLASKYGAALDVVHVYTFPTYAYTPTAPPLMTAVEEAARTEFEREMQSIALRNPGVRGFLREGVPWREILDARQELGADLIVMGTHGRRALAHALIGSVAEKMIRRSPVPVLTTHAQQDESLLDSIF